MTIKLEIPKNNFKTDFIFPTVIATVSNPMYPKDEHNIILNEEYSVNHSLGAFKVSNDRHIIDKVPKLKTWIQAQLDRYTTEVMGSDKLRFTQSWAIIHKDEPHSIYPHSHANSIISGSYYIEASEDTEPLTIMKSHHRSGTYIEYESSSNDKPWNWQQIKYATYTGRLILFPSQMMHGVVGRQINKNLRCVLAFSTWFENAIGSDEKLSSLKLR